MAGNSSAGAHKCLLCPSQETSEERSFSFVEFLNYSGGGGGAKVSFLIPTTLRLCALWVKRGNLSSDLLDEMVALCIWVAAHCV